jgi:hypothetical protein
MYQVYWTVGDVTSPGLNSIDNIVISTSSGPALICDLVVHDSDGIYFEIYTLNIQSDTLTASSEDVYSYSTWGEMYKAILESYIGDSLVLQTGADFSDIPIVPEPSTSAAFAGLGVFALAFWRRRK